MPMKLGLAASVGISANQNQLYPNRALNEEVVKYVEATFTLHKQEFDVERFNEYYDKDMRKVGNAILDLAIISWAIPDKKNFSTSKLWMEKSFTKENWGKNHDLELTQLLFGLAVHYDWHRSRYDLNFQEKLKNDIIKKASRLYEFAVIEEVWWSKSYWQNHCWINYTALLAAGLTLQHDYPPAKIWADVAAERLRFSLTQQAADGSNHEGLNYSIYGNIWLLRGLSLLQGEAETLLSNSEYLKNYISFFKAFLVKSGTAEFVDVGDSPPYLWYNPSEIFLKLFQIFDDPEYLELFHFFENRYPRKRSSLFNTVYGLTAPSLPDFELKAEPFYFSEDMGILIDRHDEGNALDSAVLFKSSVPGGRHAHHFETQSDDVVVNRSHEHPDQNQILYWSRDGFFLNDTGYLKRKMTAYHNTLLIDGRGQLGEGHQWFYSLDVQDKVFSKEDGLMGEHVFRDDELTYARANAATFYPDELGLDEFVREILWLKGRGLLILDAIAVNRPQEVSLVFQSDFEIKKSGEQVFNLEKDKREVGHFYLKGSSELTSFVESVEFETREKFKKYHQGQKLIVSASGNTSFPILSQLLIIPEDSKTTPRFQTKNPQIILSEKKDIYHFEFRHGRLFQVVKINKVSGKTEKTYSISSTGSMTVRNG